MSGSPWLIATGLIISCVFMHPCQSQNLYAPEFDQLVYDITLPENTKIGVTVLRPTVTDPDTRGSAGITYALNDTTNFIVTRRGEIEYYGGLDYEKPEIREITLVITATDPGVPPKSTSATLYIHVEDVNDVNPVFRMDVYQQRVVNGTASGEFVIQVQADDRDVNSTLTYTFVSPNPYFRLDNVTGEITTSQEVDRLAIEAGSFNILNVRCSDGLRSNIATVILTIVDPNHFVPEFSQAMYEANTDEGSAAGSRVPVVTVSASDNDVGPQSTLTYSLASTQYSNNFEINSGNGDISFVGTIDRESLPAPGTITLLVLATDSGLPPSTANATVTIVINDVDDNGPIFPSSSLHQIKMIKAFPQNQTITSLPKAVDADLGENARVFYNLSEAGLSVFDVDPSTGGLRTRYSCQQPCPLSGTTMIEFQLFAHNAANTESDSIWVRVTLVDSNTAVPVFDKPMYEANIDEGSASGSRVPLLTVTASDGDDGPQNRLTYSLSRTNYSDNFEISSGDGEITFVGTIDREVLPAPGTITLVVEATDSGFPPSTASATVNVVVNDVDDNGPKFSSSSLYQFDLYQKFPRHFKITSLPKAVDADVGENAVVVYDLSAEGLEVFAIDSSTADLLTLFSCQQTCPLSNDTYIEFDLFAYNAANRAIEGDSIRIRVNLVETPPATPPGGTSELPVVGGSEEKPVLSVTEIVVIIVVVAIILLIIFVVILVLLLRRSKTQRKRDKIKFNPSNYPPEKVENEVRIQK